MNETRRILLIIKLIKNNNFIFACILLTTWSKSLKLPFSMSAKMRSTQSCSKGSPTTTSMKWVREAGKPAAMLGGDPFSSTELEAIPVMYG